MRSIDDEWERVTQNPDNMLVSDMIRESIDKLMVRDDSVSEIAPLAVIVSDSESLQMELVRVEQSSKGWVLVGTASISVGIKAVQVTRDTWKNASILQGEDNVVWSRDLAGGEIRVDVDFPVSLGTCTITLGYTAQSVQTRVL